MTFAEQLAAANAKLDALLAPAAVTKTVTASEALVQISAELAKDKVTKERADYLRGVLASIAKLNFEDTVVIEIPVLNDPMQLKPVEVNVGSIQSFAAATPESGFASNMTALQKAQLIQKLLTDKVALKKSKLTDKLDEIKSMFGLSDDDLNDPCDLRWKVGDLISALQNAIKLENLLGAGPSSSDSSSSDTSKAAPAAPATAFVWPTDMASAKLDPVTKAYAPPVSAWGTDKA